MKKHLKLALGILLAASALLAQAVPVTSNAPSGYVGDDVVVVLSDANPVGLFGTLIKVVFDSNVLTFMGGTPGTIHGENPLDLTDPGVSLVGADPSDPFFVLDDNNAAAAYFFVSLSYPFPFGANTDPGSLMSLTFNINGSATPGTQTDVVFDCDPFADGLCLEYDFGVAGTQIPATVTILQQTGTQLPLPGTLPLIGLGVAALMWARRRLH
jgi:uncharacterized protein (TIGR03382 family)